MTLPRAHSSKCSIEYCPSKSEVILKLNSERVQYVLLSGYDYSSGEAGGDVDLLVSPQDKDIFHSVIADLGFRKRAVPALRANHVFYEAFNGSSILTLDVKYDLSFYGPRGYLWTYNKPVGKVIKDSVYENGISRPSDFDAIMLYAAHCGYLKRQNLGDRHLNSLRSKIERYRGNLSTEQQKVVDSIRVGLSQGESPGIASLLRSILTSYFTRSSGWFTKFASRVRRRIDPGLGLKILFLGPDGSGKSTLVGVLQSELPFKTKVMYLGYGEQGWVWSFAKTVRDRYKAESGFVGWIYKNLFWYFVLPVELLLRRGGASLNGRHRIVLVDRVPGVPFIRSGAISTLYKWILPSFDVAVLLHGDPSILAERKPDETDKNKVNRDIRKFKSVAHNVAQDVWAIDTTSTSISESVDKLLCSIGSLTDVKERLYKELRRVG